MRASASRYTARSALWRFKSASPTWAWRRSSPASGLVKIGSTAVPVTPTVPLSRGSGERTRTTESLLARYPEAFRSLAIDIRDREAVERVFADVGQVELVIHAAAQPSHDWAASDPHTDFTVNALGTLNLLEATRRQGLEGVVAKRLNSIYEPGRRSRSWTNRAPNHQTSG